MSAISSGKLQLGLLALALAIAMHPTPGAAYSQEEQQACTGDAFRLCGSEIPDVDRITACMIRRKAELSPPCAAFFRSPRRPDGAAAGEPASIRPAAAHKPTFRARKKRRAHPEET
ncbi:hypothetical protein [Bradyrhizobium sp. NP1]|jgi:hypothetical protein|uniref:hypothetical protein n=1 Tax=Bradyrhizobium sp. NP1 TaxID=3049772 RepID=UPI0025A5739F|nr:hypothetical protein [Bradyrhizobium sp. NP1]WJR77500.1 hypothetical protein QOU61_33085 [Bradyrhizobium sp. NP1]